MFLKKIKFRWVLFRSLQVWKWLVWKPALSLDDYKTVNEELVKKFLIFSSSLLTSFLKNHGISLFNCFWKTLQCSERFPDQALWLVLPRRAEALIGRNGTPFGFGRPKWRLPLLTKPMVWGTCISSKDQNRLQRFWIVSCAWAWLYTECKASALLWNRKSKFPMWEIQCGLMKSIGVWDHMTLI